MRHDSGRGSGSSRSFYDRTRWSSGSSTYREKNYAKTGYVQTSSDREEFSRSLHPKRGHGAFKGTFVERKEETTRTERPWSNRNHRKPVSIITRDNYNVASYHMKKENNSYLVKVWVRNLPPSYSEDDFHVAFESAGRSFSSVAWCQFYPGSPASRKETLSSAKKGFAYLAFQSLEDALVFEKEYSGMKLKDTNSGVEYGIRLFRALFPKVPSKFRYRDSLIGTIFQDDDFIRFERSLNGAQDEKDHSEENLSVSNSTRDSNNEQPLGANDHTQSVPADNSGLDKNVVLQERETTSFTSSGRDKLQSNLPTKQRYSKRITRNISSSSQSRWTPRYRVKEKTEQGGEQ
ncbi:hypothetical protein GpartN1_g7613.t1 [Galdieria partita]|uniref:RRM domain-containing protein n=1 Tax=Galdieria partita TaxID=83374 RepID=A0A9C7Q7X8_9RHOD|nr:hypothetical protein GpartN1_g7613.t1 [Galdieria partita]